MAERRRYDTHMAWKGQPSSSSRWRTTSSTAEDRALTAAPEEADSRPFEKGTNWEPDSLSRSNLRDLRNPFAAIRLTGPARNPLLRRWELPGSSDRRHRKHRFPGFRMATVQSIVCLVDVDNTLLDNDSIQQDLKDHLELTYGPDARDRYWNILEELFSELGYRDYLGALQRFRAEHPREVELLSMSAYLIDYPFAGRLFPSALEVLRRLTGLGPTVILSDGDVVFQPRKVERAGLSDAIDGRVLIYIHKEEALDDVERRFPAEHYMLVDGGGQALLGRPRHDCFRATGQLCSRRQNCRRHASASGCHDRAHRRSYKLRPDAIAADAGNACT
jgi:hypothetical protein